MPEAPNILTAWRRLLERSPETRRGDPLIVEAAYAEPQLRALYPFPTHGTLHFLRSAPPWRSDDRDDLPFIVCGKPPYRVYASGYSVLLGEVSTPTEAAAVVVAYLPAAAPTCDGSR